MGDRLNLQAIFKAMVRNVYFQPPDNMDIKYDCIIYEKTKPNVIYANNSPYLRKKQYLVKVITRSPDSDIAEKVANLPLSSFDRAYTADGLFHEVYKVYY